jgi:uncharacterized lipoprotein YmbA
MKRYVGSWLPFLLCTTACSSGPPLRTFVLTPTLAPTGPAPATALPTERIVIRRVLVPDYLDTTDILMRHGRNEVKVDGTGRWGERLSQGLTRALAADLAARLPSDALVVDGSSPAQRQVEITVNSLDLWPDGRCVLAATWSIVDRAAPRAVAGGSGTFESPAVRRTIDVGDAYLVDVISGNVGKLADMIALNIRQRRDRSSLPAH